ncbi:MAG TPA: anti-sigma factor, partial [Candidatus Lustribacter sp.]
MTCNWCEERFERFLDGVLTEGERARLLVHVGGCEECRGLLEELRVVDALLLEPRTVELPPNFTRATMADVRAMPLPHARRAPIAASLVAYIVAAWSLAGAAALIAPDVVLTAGKSAFGAGSTVLGALTGLARAFAHLGDRGDMTSWTTLAGGVVIADALVLI